LSEAVGAPARPTFNYLSESISRRELTLTIGGLMMSLFLASLNQSIVNTAIPRIVSELNGFEIYAWVTTSYMLTSTAAVPVIGKIGDSHGRKPLLVGGTLYFLVTTALCGLAQDMTQLIVLRALQGVGGGIITATAFATIAELLPPAQRARMSGLFTGVFSLSTVLGPVMGGYLTDNLSWRGVFYASLPFGIIGLLVLWLAFPDVRRSRKRLPIDISGAVTVMGASALLLLALSWGGRQFAWGSPQVLGLVGAAALLLVLFVWIESRAADPVVPLSMFRNNVVAISAFGAGAQSIGVFGASLFIPLFVQGVIGTSATVSGSIMAPMMLTMLVASIFGGQLIARTGRCKPILLVGLTTSALGMLLLSTLGADAQYSAIVLYMIVVGLGTGLTGPTLTISAQNASKPGELGVVTALLQFARSMGNTLGTAVFGSVLTLRFLPEMQSAVPVQLAPQLGAAGLEMIRDPQALLNPSSAAALRSSIGKAFPDSPDAVALVFDAIRAGLAGSLHWVFLAAALVLLSALLAALFLRELPLRGRGSPAHSDSHVLRPAQGQRRRVQFGQTAQS
jgi:EmrB/QacA subfamily drug resistance transporter